MFLIHPGEHEGHEVENIIYSHNPSCSFFVVSISFLRVHQSWWTRKKRERRYPVSDISAGRLPDFPLVCSGVLWAARRKTSACGFPGPQIPFADAPGQIRMVSIQRGRGEQVQGRIGRCLFLLQDKGLIVLRAGSGPFAGQAKPFGAENMFGFGAFGSFYLTKCGHLVK